MENFKLYSSFSSWDEFEKAAKAYIEATSQPFVKSSSKTVELQNKVCKEKNPLEMEYYYKMYSCSHRGKFKPRGSGQRETMSLKEGCTAKIQARLDSKDKKKIVVTVLDERHNHTIGERNRKEQLNESISDIVLDIHNYSTDYNKYVKIEVGSEFEDYKAFEGLIQRRQEYLGEKWVKCRNMRTVVRANKSIANQKLHYNEKFCYAILALRCCRSGTAKSKAVCHRKFSAKNLTCPAMIEIRANRMKNKMVVTRCCLQHNHDLDLPFEVQHPAQLHFMNGLEIKCMAMPDNAELTNDPAVTSTTISLDNLVDIYSSQPLETSESVVANELTMMNNSSLMPPPTVNPSTYVTNCDSNYNDIDKKSSVKLNHLLPVISATSSCEPLVVGGTTSSSSSSSNQRTVFINNNNAQIPEEIILEIEDGITERGRISNIINNVLPGVGSDQLNFNITKTEPTESIELTKDFIASLLESKNKELEKDKVRQSMHYNYGLTVIEKLDLLNLKTAFSARKEIDDILMKYVVDMDE